MRQFIQGVVVFVLLAAARPSARAEAGFTNNSIHGTISFSNVNPDVLSLLGPPQNDGVTNFYVSAYSGPPENRTASTDTLQATTPTTASYEISVDSDATGIAYAVYPRMNLLSDRMYYYFQSVTSAPVVAFDPSVTLDFSECVGVVNVRFRDASDQPFPVDDGTMVATALDGSGEIAHLYSIPAGSTEQRFYLRGGAPVQLAITITLGTNFYENRLNIGISTNLTVDCDTISNIDIAFPMADLLGRAEGTVDLLREFAATIDGSDALDYPDYTSVVADLGPFGNKRFAAVPGMNYTVPASGTFVLSNLVPSTLDPQSVGYAIGANMVIRSNRMVEYFHTPSLGWGSNAALVVAPGADLNLSNLFVIDPGEMQGKILLQGPAESLGRKSHFRNVLHSGDDDADHDGLPDAIGIYGVYDSSIGFSGVDRLATGASFTAANGYASADFDGQFNPTTSTFDGQYSLAMGGLNGERSLWRRSTLSLLMSSGPVDNDDDYYYYGLGIVDKTVTDQEIVPRQTNSEDAAYCFSEVCIRFRSATEPFYNPEVRFSNGEFEGLDFQGHPAQYSVYVDPAFGTPNLQSAASTNGQVFLYLPQGTYHLTPYITPSNSVSAEVGGAVLDLTVGCGQRICLEQCLQVDLSAPTCSAAEITSVSGQVRSCGNTVTKIQFTLNDEATTDVCTDCGADPTFVFPVKLSGGLESENILTVTATDANGGTASVTTTIRFDNIPPSIECPKDIVTECLQTNQARVSFTVLATDNYPGPVAVVCDPPSGSLFKPGITTVVCHAEDGCGNQSGDCSFKVEVRSQALTIEKAVIVRWDCGVLQGAETADGPWTDIPGAANPYCVPADRAHLFYRSRQ